MITKSQKILIVLAVLSYVAHLFTGSTALAFVSLGITASYIVARTSR